MNSIELWGLGFGHEAEIYRARLEKGLFITSQHVCNLPENGAAKCCRRDGTGCVGRQRMYRRKVRESAARILYQKVRQRLEWLELGAKIDVDPCLVSRLRDGRVGVALSPLPLYVFDANPHQPITLLEVPYR